MDMLFSSLVQEYRNSTGNQDSPTWALERLFRAVLQDACDARRNDVVAVHPANRCRNDLNKWTFLWYPLYCVLAPRLIRTGLTMPTAGVRVEPQDSCNKGFMKRVSC
jgi:hypothetical protein